MRKLILLAMAISGSAGAQNAPSLALAEQMAVAKLFREHCTDGVTEGALRRIEAGLAERVSREASGPEQQSFIRGAAAAFEATLVTQNVQRGPDMATICAPLLPRIGRIAIEHITFAPR